MANPPPPPHQPYGSLPFHDHSMVDDTADLEDIAMGVGGDDGFDFGAEGTGDVDVHSGPVNVKDDRPTSPGAAGHEDAEIRAAMATLNNAALDAGSVLSRCGRENESLDSVGHKSKRPPKAKAKGTATSQKQQEPNSTVQNRENDRGAQQLKRKPSSVGSDAALDTSEDDDVPVAVPVDEAQDGAISAVDTTASTLKENCRGINKKKLKRDYSDVSSSGSKRGRRKSMKVGGGPTRSKSYQGSYRSAAAAHRSRQIHVPPVGSPGLLMLPTPAVTAVFPRIQNEEEVKKWLVGDGYLLPSTVFKHSMIAGGYTLEKRREVPHRGSSTERTVGDMFDSDAGGLYLHFPELIPLGVWDRRLGDDVVEAQKRPLPRAKEEGKSPKERGGNGSSSLRRENDSKDTKDAKEGKEGPSGPKGARSSYIFFTNVQRPKMAMEFPGMRFTEQGVIMGERWRALKPEEKKPYEDMANKDKERYSREMKDYIESVKREIKEEKDFKNDDCVKEGQPNECRKEGEVQEKHKEKPKERETKGKDSEVDRQEESLEGKEVRGPRLVDAVIMSLNKLFEEKSNADNALVGIANAKAQAKLEPIALSKEKDPELNLLAEASDSPPGSLGNGVACYQSRRISPDLTLAELPQFTPSDGVPRTRRRCPPHAPMSFLDMIPTSLTSTYPSAYVASRRSYAVAVRAREIAIVDAQEAKDDHDDAQEKYIARSEQWEKMLEYQRVQIAKKEMERKRQREKEEKEAEGKRKQEELEGSKDGQVGIILASDQVSESKEDMSSKVEEDTNAPIERSGSDVLAEGKKTERPLEEPSMPPRPQPPGPARVVSIPDIPIPPSPPLVIPIDDVGESCCNDLLKGDVEGHSIQAPKIDGGLLQHLDTSFFLPTMEGRYFGLLSNQIADPQFHGIMAPGISGTTHGGGTGLATSYVGGGRGAVGLVSGPLRGGNNLWERAATGSSGKGGNSGKGGSERGERRSSAKTILMKEKTSFKASSTASSDSINISAIDPEEERAYLDVKRGGSSPSKLMSSPALSSAKKRCTSDIPPNATAFSAEKKKKKQKRTTIGLATGDRNTSATEIASGSAGSEFPDGWIIKTYRRNGGETIGKTDRFWFSPGRNIRFRAKKHALAFKEILAEPDVDGDEDRAAEIYRARGLHF